MIVDGQAGYGPAFVQASRPRVDRATAFKLNLVSLLIWATVLAPWAAVVHDRPSRVAPGGDREEGVQGLLMWWSVVFFWIFMPTLIFSAAPLLWLPQLMALAATWLLARRILAALGLPARLTRDAVPLVWAARPGWAGIAAVAWLLLTAVPYVTLAVANEYEWAWLEEVGVVILRLAPLATGVWTVVVGIVLARELRAVIEPPVLRRRQIEGAMRTVMRIPATDTVIFDVDADGGIIAPLPPHAAAAPEAIARAAGHLFPDHEIVRLDAEVLVLQPLSRDALQARAAERQAVAASDGLLRGPVEGDVPPRPQTPPPGAAPWAVYPG